MSRFQKAMDCLDREMSAAKAGGKGFIVNSILLLKRQLERAEAKLADKAEEAVATVKGWRT